MLQQTQSSTVIPYFLRWMSRFPTVESLAKADPDQVLATWQGLGYYRRCRMLQAGAQHVAANGFPSHVRDWKKVPGVGPYTAGAITSIAFNQPEPLVDGNVMRVYSRVTADSSTPKLLEKNSWVWTSLQLESGDSNRRPGDWNQALMELGATVCKPTQPECSACPISGECQAFQCGKPTLFPAQSLKPKSIAINHSAVIPIYFDSAGNRLLGLEKIPDGEWWEKMWRFPKLPFLGVPTESLGVIRHSVTNHRITLNVLRQHLETPDESLCWFASEEVQHIAMPSPQRRALALLDIPRGLPLY